MFAFDGNLWSQSNTVAKVIIAYHVNYFFCWKLHTADSKGNDGESSSLLLLSTAAFSDVWKVQKE